MKNFFLKAIACSVAGLFFVLSSTAVFADMQSRDFAIEYRVSILERQVAEMNRNMAVLQKRIDELTANLPNTPVDVVAACMIVDSTYSKTFLGVAKNKLDAEFLARNACQASLSSANLCGHSATLKCDDNSKPTDAHGYVCMVTDSAYAKNFRGNGRTAVEAEAKAKQACQNSVGASTCGNAPTRCAEQF
jgi:hypothetical protein